MARVTVEDCVLKVPNRFNLVMYAAQRARNISAGAEETLERDNDKNPVVALREIADQTIELDDLQENLILGLQKQHPSDDLEEDEEAIEVLAQESALLGLASVKKEEAGDEKAEAEAESESDSDEESDAEEGGEGDDAASGEED